MRTNPTLNEWLGHFAVRSSKVLRETGAFTETDSRSAISGTYLGLQKHLEVFTRIGPDNSSLNALLNAVSDSVTDRPRDVHELFVTLFEYVFITGLEAGEAR